MMSWLLYLLYVVLLVLLVWQGKFFEVKSVSKRIITAAFLLKLMAGLAVTLIYTYYYTDKQNSDIYKYFDDGLVLHSFFYTQPKLFFQLITEINIETPEVLNAIKDFNHWDPKVRSNLYNDSRFIIKLNAMLAFISLGNIYIHALFAAFIGFSGLIAFSKAAERVVGNVKHYTLLLLFFPSILLWTSGMLKETILIALLGFFLFVLIKIKTNSSGYFWWMIAAVLLLLLIVFKVYVLLCLLAAGLFYFLTTLARAKWQIGLGLLLALMLFPLAAFLVDHFILHDAISGGIAQKQYDTIRLAQYMKAGSVVYIPLVEAGNWLSFVLAAPFALWNVLFEPMIWRVSSPFMLAAALENLFLAALLIFSVTQIRTINPAQFRLMMAVFLFSILLFTIIGITTPVMGSIVRYRVPGLMVLLMIPGCFCFNQATKFINAEQ